MNVRLTVTLFWYNPRLLCYGNCPWKILVSIRITWFTKLNRKVCIKTRSTPASLPSTIVKWPIRAFLSNNTRRIARCYLLWRPDFTPFNKVTISKLSLENHLKPFAHTSDNISKRLYIYFFWQGKFEFKFTRSFTWFRSFRNSTLTIWVMFLFLSCISTVFKTENPACSKSPSSVSRENNCMKAEINRGKCVPVTAKRLGKVPE